MAACEGDLATLKAFEANDERFDDLRDSGAMDAAMICVVSMDQDKVFEHIFMLGDIEHHDTYIGLVLLHGGPKVKQVLFKIYPSVGLYDEYIQQLVDRSSGGKQLRVVAEIYDRETSYHLDKENSPCFVGNLFSVWLQIEKYVLATSEERTGLPFSIIGMLLLDTISIPEGWDVEELITSDDQVMVKLHDC